MRSGRLALLALILLPAPAGGQAVSDGVLALVRGEFPAAARILESHARRDNDPDPLAAFFLGSLYHAGRIAGGDQMEACGLYMDAARISGSPIAITAESLLHDLSGPEATSLFWELCEQTRHQRAAPNSLDGDTRRFPNSTTEAGVVAFVNQDYVVASQLLTPAAEAWPPADGVAAFFMGLMYENGLGLGVDDFRACQMYMLALGKNPIGRWLDNVLPMGINGRMTQERFEECLYVTSLGLHHGFEPVTIPLENGAWISIDLRGATISSRGTEKRITRDWGIDGALFLPIRHTELMAGPLHNQRRSCIEIAQWIPADPLKRDRWSLHWQLFEVREDTLADVATDEIATRNGRPESDSRGTLDDYVRLQVNDAGEPGWTLR